jgi:DNA-binding CsgD family transcriptional regulator
LNRQVALEVLCRTLASAVQADDWLVDAIMANCRHEAELLQRPDPKQLQRLTKDESRLERSIEFCQRNPGESDDDLRQTAQALREFRAELGRLRSDKALLDQAQKQAVAIPTEDEVRSLLAEMDAILLAAATDHSEQDAGVVRHIIDLLTGGRIDLYQMGERRKYRGWLQGRFQLDIVSAVARKTLGFEPSPTSSAREVAIDFKSEPARVKQSEIAFQWYQQNLLGKEIAELMGVSRSRVSALLKSVFASRGLERPDGRGRRATLRRKQVKIPVYQKIAADVVQMANRGKTNKDIAEALEVSPPTVVAALKHWSSMSGLPVRNSRERRRALLPLARERYESGVTLKLIAQECGYSPRGVKLALQGHYRELGLDMPTRGATANDDGGIVPGDS